MNNTKFSIIMPAYNSAKTIQKAVKSILANNYKDFELIVVDDGSEDDTENIISEFKDKIIVIRKNNGGVSSARNTGIEKAKNEYLVFCDADDEITPDCLQRLNHAIVKHDKPDYIRYGGVKENCHHETEEIRLPKQGKSLLEQATSIKGKIDCYVPLLCIKKSKAKKFNEKIRYLEDDLFYIENLSQPEAKSITINDKLYIYKYNSDSKTKNPKNIKDNFIDIAQAAKEILATKYICNTQKDNNIKANITNMFYWKIKDYYPKLNQRQKAENTLLIKKLIQRNNLKPRLLKTPIKEYIKYLLIKTSIVDIIF